MPHRRRERAIVIAAIVTLIPTLLTPAGLAARSTESASATASESSETAIEVVPRSKLGSLFEAISGKKAKPKSAKILSGASQISRVGDRVILKKLNADDTEFSADTEFGGKVIGCLDDAAQSAREKFGPDAAEFVQSLKTISVNGDRVEFERLPADELHITVPETRHWIPFRVREVDVGKLTMRLTEVNGHPALREIDGLKATVRIGKFDLPIVLREFSRRKKADGNTEVTFGIQSLVPLPLRRLLFLKDVMSVTCTIKKKPDGDDTDQAKGTEPADAKTTQ
jgi:hypothetical protein